jgi:sulfopyruvate decarboxylase subunit beta
MMKRDQCFRALARHVTDEIVVATYSSAVDWLELGERALNYFSVGALGLDSSDWRWAGPTGASSVCRATAVC